MKIISSTTIRIHKYNPNVAVEFINIGDKITVDLNGHKSTVEIFNIPESFQRHYAIEVIYDNKIFSIPFENILDGLNFDKNNVRVTQIVDYILYTDSGDILMEGDRCVLCKPVVDTVKSKCDIKTYHGVITKINHDKISIVLDDISESVLCIYGFELKHDKYLIEREAPQYTVY